MDLFEIQSNAKRKTYECKISFCAESGNDKIIKWDAIIKRWVCLIELDCIFNIFLNDDELQYGDTSKQAKMRGLLDIVEIIRAHIPIVQRLK